MQTTYKKQSVNDEHGAMLPNILLIMLLIVIIALIYVISGDRNVRSGRTIGTTSPEYMEPAATPGQAATKNNTDADTNEDADTAEFDDGLKNPESVTKYPLNDIGEGLASVETFRIDINNDGLTDKITRSRQENGTSHFSYQYKIEINTGDGFVDITPDDFYTIEGAECSLQKIRFAFSPAFRAIKISRPWEDSWPTPTPAVRDTYSLIHDQIHHIETQDLPVVCDVSELF